MVPTWTQGGVVAQCLIKNQLIIRPILLLKERDQVFRSYFDLLENKIDVGEILPASPLDDGEHFHAKNIL